MKAYSKQSRLYHELLPSFVLMAANQPSNSPWRTIPAISEQARACSSDTEDYLEAIMNWSGIDNCKKDRAVHCLEALPSIENACFNQVPDGHSLPSSITLVETSDLDIKHRWQVRISTPFGDCGVGGAGEVITDTDFFNFANTHHEKAGLAESVFANHKEQPLYIENPGTVFIKEIRKKLLSLPQGYHVSYGFLGKGRSARAVGGAMKSNPFIVTVPCHRVLGHNFSLNGYAGGNQPEHLARKIAIILYERLQLD